jgi:hypothetical protein
MKKLLERARYGILNIIKLDFLEFYYTARSEAFTEDNIKARWKRISLLPYSLIYLY